MITAINIGKVRLALLGGLACGGAWSSRAPASHVAAPLEADDKANETAMRFLEERVKRDPDISAHNKLADYYHLRLRETGDLSYLDLAARAARASLASVPEVRNAGGLAALVQSEFAAHAFAAARDHAMQLGAT